MRALPKIQAQKYEEMLKPYRLRLARVLLGAGDLDGAKAQLHAVLRVEPDNFTAWAYTVGMAIERRDADAIAAALRDAESAGVRNAELEFLRERVRQNVPDFFETPEEE